MSPTILTEGPYRFFFFSREETRMHVHVVCSDGEAKFWLEPIVALANYTGLNSRQLKKILKLVDKNEKKFCSDWKKHFSS